MFDTINVIKTSTDALNTFTIRWPLFRLQSIVGRIICSSNELTSTNNAGHEDFVHAALGEWERDGAGVDGETRTLVHLLESHFLSMFQEPGRNILMTQSQSRGMSMSSIGIYVSTSTWQCYLLTSVWQCPSTCLCWPWSPLCCTLWFPPEELKLAVDCSFLACLSLPSLALTRPSPGNKTCRRS